MNWLRLAGVILLHCIASTVVLGGSTREMIYESIAGSSCIRRLNGTHQIGCSSTRSGSRGILYLIESESDYDKMLSNADFAPYVPLVPTRLFNRKFILRLKSEGVNSIAGIVLMNRTEDTTSFSHETNCPNRYAGIMLPGTKDTATCDTENAANSWNSWGTGLLHEDLPFPIYYVDDEEEIVKLTDCFRTYNTQMNKLSSLCAVEINTFMSGAVNTEVCMRRSQFLTASGIVTYCDPMEGKNVFATLFPRLTEPVTKTNERFILVTTRLDTTSMFDSLGLGAKDSLLGYATLFSVAHTLRQLISGRNNLSKDNMNVLFVAFNGESYDYIGSQRFVFDMENRLFPSNDPLNNRRITLDDIEFMLDIGTLDEPSAINLHALRPNSVATQLLQKLDAIQAKHSLAINFTPSVGAFFPPTSAQSFLRRNQSFPAFVLNSKPTNRYYHSIYDNAENLGYNYKNTTQDFTRLMSNEEALKLFSADAIQLRISNIATSIAITLYEYLTGKEYEGDRLANPILVDEMLHCFLQSADCALLRAASRPNSSVAYPIPPLRQIGVAGSMQDSYGWTGRLFGYLLSSTVPDRNESSCKSLPLYWFAGYNGNGECRLTTLNYTSALSPAFIIDGYDYASGEYSTWTISMFSDISARIFLRPSNVYGFSILGIGVVFFVITLRISYLAASKSDVLFGALTPTSAFT